ncbi:MAG: SRPBCC family protein [candidate division WS1 bacterium]|jgi:uncharacterized protein YndB with AHSA1/START domain|nr:SRPBCC family protein [candidate division WS1 bacterium]
MARPEFIVSQADNEVIQRLLLDAPRERVWELMTDPELIPQWWGPAALTTTVEQMDVTEGGKWRYVQRDAEGNEHVFSGVYREVVPPERTAGTFEYENEPGDVMFEVATLEELPDGNTLLTIRSRFESSEALNAAVESGMEAGATESLERFEELVARS